MKKNLFPLIGSLLACFSFYFLNTPYYATGKGATPVTINNLLGFANDVYYRSGNLTLQSLVLCVSLLSAVVALLITVGGIIANKNVNREVVVLSSVNAFSAYILIQNLKNLVENDYVIGWGSIIVLALFILFFILSFVGFCISCYSERTKSKELLLDDIYKYKKLLDDGIISKDEFETKKQQLLK